MLEGLAAWVLKTYIGKYVNVNVDKLNFGLLSGKVELENVALKPDSFNSNEMPFELKFGYIGKIKLNLSLNSLRYTPWSFIAENLCIIIGPKQIADEKKDEQTGGERRSAAENDQHASNGTASTSTMPAEATRNGDHGGSAEAEAQLASSAEEPADLDEQMRKEKLEKLINLEKKWFKEVELLGLIDNNNISLSQDKSKLFSFLGPMAYSLMKNLQVDLNKIHIRYEDEANNFSIGFFIQAITIRNASEIVPGGAEHDAAGSEADGSDSSNLSFKSCDIKSFSIYSDLNILHDPSCSIEAIFEKMSFDQIGHEFTTSSKFAAPGSPNSFKYIIHPTSFQAQLIRDTSPRPLRKLSKPRIRLLSNLNDFKMHIDQNQISYFFEIARSINIYNNRMLFKSIERPKAPPPTGKRRAKTSSVERKAIARQWWLYACACIKLKLDKRTMRDFVNWSHDVNRYRAAYESILCSRFGSVPSNESSSLKPPSIDPIPRTGSYGGRLSALGVDAATAGVEATAAASLSRFRDVSISSNMSESFVDCTITLDLELLMKEMSRIEAEWSYERLLILRRLVFERFIRSSLYTNHLNNLRLESTRAEPAADAAHSAQSAQTAQANNYMGVYGYLSWHLTSAIGYYFRKNTSAESSSAKPSSSASSSTGQRPVNIDGYNLDELDKIQPNKIDDQVIGFINDSLENENLFRRDTLLANLEFKLESASITLSCNNSLIDGAKKKSDAKTTRLVNSYDLIELRFERSHFLLKILPRHDSFLFETKLGAFTLRDCTFFQPVQTQPSYNNLNEFSLLIYPKTHIDNEEPTSANNHSTTSNGDSNEQFVLEICYEHRPMNCPNKYANLSIKSCGLDIVYNQFVIRDLLKYWSFISNYNTQLNDILFNQTDLYKFLKTHRANQFFSAATTNTTTSSEQPNNLENNINNHSFNINSNHLTNLASVTYQSSIHNINFNFEITAPKIIFPQNITNINSMVVVFDFGHMKFHNRAAQKTVTPTSEAVAAAAAAASRIDEHASQSHRSSLVPWTGAGKGVERRGSLEDLHRTFELGNEDEDSENEIFETPACTPPSELFGAFGLDERESTNSACGLGKESSHNRSFNQVSDDINILTSNQEKKLRKLQKSHLAATMSSAAMVQLVLDRLKSSNSEKAMSNQMNFYTVFDLNLKDLQVVVGKFKSDALNSHLSTGKGQLHLLEKFDIFIQFDVAKFRSSQMEYYQTHNTTTTTTPTGLHADNESMASSSGGGVGGDRDSLSGFRQHNEWPQLRINLKFNQFTLHIDDLKLIHMYRTWETIQRSIEVGDAGEPGEVGETPEISLTKNPNPSQAIILRLSALVEHCQWKHKKHLQASLQSVEMFSCQSHAIEETALSIIEPVTFTLNLKSKTDELLLAPPSPPPRESAAVGNKEFLLDITTETLKLRISYLDFRLFLQLIESIKVQFDSSKAAQMAGLGTGENGYKTTTTTTTMAADDEDELKDNQHGDYTSTSDDESSSESRHEAAEKLKKVVSVERKEAKSLLSSVNINIDKFHICIIDDCRELEIPLMDVQLSRFKLAHSINETAPVELSNFDQLWWYGRGKAEFALNIDYYNRLLSGWEPLIEPWLACFCWNFGDELNTFKLTSMDVLNVNFTNPFIDLITSVAANWKEDYENKSQSQQKLAFKRHKTFQPYRIVNLTGEPIKFCTFVDTNTSTQSIEPLVTRKNLKESLSAKLLATAAATPANPMSAVATTTTSPLGIKRSVEQALKASEAASAVAKSALAASSSAASSFSDWVTIEDRCSYEFNFFQHKRENYAGAVSSNSIAYLQRAHNYLSRELVQHRIRVKLEDWSEIRAITVDKVGTYFRDMNRNQMINAVTNPAVLLNSTRIVFDISLSENATKLIEIKSPVSIKNTLDFKVQCRIESRVNSIMNRLGPLIVEIASGGELSIPIKYLPCNLWFRPLDLGNKEANFSLKSINCDDVTQSGQIEYYQIACKLTSVFNARLGSTTGRVERESAAAAASENEIYHFFVKIKRLAFPATKSAYSKENEHLKALMPGHMICLEPSLMLYNLLPIEMGYQFTSKPARLSGESARKRSAESAASASASSPLVGKLDPYNYEHFKSIDVSNSMDIVLEIDNFRMVRAIEINPAKHLSNVNQSSSAGASQSSKSSSSSSSSSSASTSASSGGSDSPAVPLAQSVASGNQSSSQDGLGLLNKKLTILKRIDFQDDNNRPMFLIARIVFKIGSGMNRSIAGNGDDSSGLDTDYFLKNSPASYYYSSGGSNGGSSEHQPAFNPCPVVIHISAVYCFFNLTGLPLVFRQHDCKEAAGQLEEHEVAVSNQPLLFSYTEADSPYACSMRIGKGCKDFKVYMNQFGLPIGAQAEASKKIQPKWCTPFGLDSGSSFRALNVTNNLKVAAERQHSSFDHDDSSLSSSLNSTSESYLSQSPNSSSLLLAATADSGVSSSPGGAATSSKHSSTPDWVYYIGIEIKPGKGLLKDSTFVYFSTRFYLVNKSSRSLVVSQLYNVRHLTEDLNSQLMMSRVREPKPDDDETDDVFNLLRSSKRTSAAPRRGFKPSDHSIILLSDSMTQFHWPRSDHDKLLSVCIKDEPNYSWSGGFRIDMIDSFYLNLRSKASVGVENLFLRVEVMLDGGTFFVIFYDRIDFPLPVRIENYSQVPIYFHQAHTPENKYLTNIKPGQVVKYAWDEPAKAKQLLIGVRGGASEIFDTSQANDFKHLYYENFIYIAFTDTFLESGESGGGGLLGSGKRNFSSADLFKSSQQKKTLSGGVGDEYAIDQELVLSVYKNRVIVDRKESGNRAQLWHMTTQGLLVHEGSSPPKELANDSTLDLSNRYVLDIEDVAPQPNRMLRLALRRPDQLRSNTQSWHFTKTGHLCCKVLNMCLQVSGKLERNSNVVLGPMNPAVNPAPSLPASGKPEPSRMRVGKQRLRPGSGHLSVEMNTDGPTCVFRITNIRDQAYFYTMKWQKANHLNNQHSLSTNHSSSSATPAFAKSAESRDEENGGGKGASRPYQASIDLSKGIGISFVHWYNQEYEELVYASLKTFEVAFGQTIDEQTFVLSIQSIQLCNQLLNSTKENVLCIQTPQNGAESDSASAASSYSYSAPNDRILQPALHVNLFRQFTYENIVTIKHLIINVADVNLQIEEKLLWKIIHFVGFGKPRSRGVQGSAEFKADKEAADSTRTDADELFGDESQENSRNSISSTTSLPKTGGVSGGGRSEKRIVESNLLELDSIANTYYKRQVNILVSSSKERKYSFNKFQINPLNMVLSVYKTPKLSPELLKIKSALGIPLIQFENARIECKQLRLLNENDTLSSLLNLVKKHYTQELRSHAIPILGSVDFLGNPLGLMVDFKESISNVLSNGQVTDFVFSITHGVANSFSKFSGFLSDELNELTMDEGYRETRMEIRNIYNNGSFDHFVGGALGFAVGVVGGALSIATQTYKGFNENGLTGAFAGLGRGAIGTVSKPIVGVLDLANGIASAIRETSKTTYKMELTRIRESRCCANPGSLLKPFSRSDADGQKILYLVNNFDLNEKYISLEPLSSKTGDRLIGIVTSQRVLFIKSSDYYFKTMYEVKYMDLKTVNLVEDGPEKVFLEAILESQEDHLKKSIRFRFENKQAASSLANKIRFAKASYDETFYNLLNYKDDEE